MNIELKEFDAAEYLTDDEARAAYLSAVLESGDSEEFILAVGDIAKSIGMAKIAEDAGVGRNSLYKTFSAKKPRFDTMLKVIHALGMNISVTAQHKKA